MSDVGFLVMDLRDREPPGPTRRGFLARTWNRPATTPGSRCCASTSSTERWSAPRSRVSGSPRRPMPASARSSSRSTGRIWPWRRPKRARLISGVVITHGVTGSGKTTRAAGDRRVARAPSASGRMSNANGSWGSTPAHERDLRSAGACTRATRAGRPTCGSPTWPREIVAAGYPVVVDAAFLERWQRDLLRGTAAGLHVPFAILNCPAPEPVSAGTGHAAARRRSRRIGSDDRRARAPAGDGRTASGRRALRRLPARVG